jgi:hypothetical protein
VQTIKTAVVVVLLLGVCYGAYVALNAPEPVLPPELEAWSSENGGMSLDVEEGSALSIDIPQLGDASSSDLNALTPPNLSTLGAPPASSSSQPSQSHPLGEAPALPSLDVGQLDSPKLGGLLGSSSAGSEFGIPPELEGSSVPLPGAGQTTMASVVPKQDESKTTLLPGFAAPDAGSLASSPLLPSQPGATDAAAANPSQSNGATDPKNQTGKPQQSFKAAREEALKLASDGKLRTTTTST